MPKRCCIRQCKTDKRKNPYLTFYMLPNQATEARRRALWLSTINKGTLKSDYNYVCSRHFISGEKSNDPEDRDYTPWLYLKPADYEESYRRIKEYRAAQTIPEPVSNEDEFDHEGDDEATGTEPAIPEPVSIEDEFDHEGEVEATGSAPTTSRDPEEEWDSDHEGDDEVTGPDDQWNINLLGGDERDSLYEEIYNLREERDEAIYQVKKLKETLKTSNLSSYVIENNDQKAKMMTGLTWGIFLQIFFFLSSFLTAKATNKHSLPLREQFFITLIKLRHGLTFDLLATAKGIKKSTAIDYFWKWINLMHAKLNFLIKFQDRSNIFRIIPPVFKTNFPKLTAIVDCFEIFIDSPKNFKARAQCWSNYKNHCTVKFFISCSPLGHINFISKAYGGRASDVQIVRESGYISNQYHYPGDEILADRGFTLREEFATYCGVLFYTPSFTKGKRQLSAEEVETSRKLSSIRIHIERVIGLLKNRFAILKRSLPIQTVQSITNEVENDELASIDKIVQVIS